MNQPAIEQATLEDLPLLTDLLMDLFATEEDFKPDRIKQMRGLRLILEQPNRGRVFVIKHHGMILGMINILFTISTAEGGFVLLLEDLVINKDHRGCGFGGRLIEHVISYAKQKDFMRITLLTDRTHESSRSFFRKYGFQESTMIPMRLLLNGK